MYCGYANKFQQLAKSVMLKLKERKREGEPESVPEKNTEGKILEGL